MNEQSQLILTLLREVPLFSGLTIEELERLSEEFILVELPKDETLYRAQETTDGLFVINSGQLALLDEDGKQLEILKRAEVIGTEALNYLRFVENRRWHSQVPRFISSLTNKFEPYTMVFLPSRKLHPFFLTVFAWYPTFQWHGLNRVKRST